jgi:hypothetical protein
VTVTPELRPGELARASDWALDIGERAAATVARQRVATTSGGGVA